MGSTVVTVAEKFSKRMVINSILTEMVAIETFTRFSHRESYESYTSLHILHKNFVCISLVLKVMKLHIMRFPLSFFNSSGGRSSLC